MNFDPRGFYTVTARDGPIPIGHADPLPPSEKSQATDLFAPRGWGTDDTPPDLPKRAAIKARSLKHLLPPPADEAAAADRRGPTAAVALAVAAAWQASGRPAARLDPHPSSKRGLEDCLAEATHDGPIEGDPPRLLATRWVCGFDQIAQAVSALGLPVVLVTRVGDRFEPDGRGVVPPFTRPVAAAADVAEPLVAVGYEEVDGEPQKLLRCRTLMGKGFGAAGDVFLGPSYFEPGVLGSAFVCIPPALSPDAPRHPFAGRPAVKHQPAPADSTPVAPGSPPRPDQPADRPETHPEPDRPADGV